MWTDVHNLHLTGLGIAFLLGHEFALRFDEFVQLVIGLAAHAGALQHHGVGPAVQTLIMHKSLPDNLNASLSGMALLGLLKICRNRSDEPGWNALRRIAHDQADLFEAISYQRVEEYCRLAEQLVREEFAGESLSYCPCCDTKTIVGDRCEACFEHMGSTTCAATGGRVFFPSWWRRFEDAPREVECPHCGESHAVP